MPGKTSPATLNSASAPSARSLAYYVDWVRELTELHRRGMLADEDFALQRGERLAELMNKPRRRWLWWIHAAVPLAGFSGVVGWWWTGDLGLIRTAALVVVLCVLAALSRYSREWVHHLSVKERSDVLYHLLGEGLIASEEFLVFDDDLTHGARR